MYAMVNIRNEIITPFFKTKKELYDYEDKYGVYNEAFMWKMEYFKKKDFQKIFSTTCQICKCKTFRKVAD